MKKLKLSLAFIASLSILLASGCSDDHVYSSLDELNTATGAITGDTGDLGDSTPTGRITADGFFVLYNPAIPEVFDDNLSYTLQTVEITVFAEDVNELVELNGQTVNFKVEWGAFLDGRDSCDLVNGQCTVIWRSGDPSTAPGSCLVAVTAWTTGEEAFFDANDNGLFDDGESFADLEEPFLDIDYLVGPSSGSFDGTISTVEGVGELIDITDFYGDGSSLVGDHDPGNGFYDGSLCAAGNPDCSGRTSMIIHTRSTLQIQEPFDHDSDANTPDINVCTGNPY